MKRILLYILAAAVLLSDRAPAAIREYWLYKSTNLLVDTNVAELQALIERAKACGVTHLLLTDSKFSRLAEMPERYFRNAGAIKSAAAAAGIAIVPAVCPVGYSNDLLYSDPNLIEALPVKGTPLTVKGGKALLLPPGPPLLKGGDMADLSLWGWKDENVIAQDGAAWVKDPGGRNARITQKVTVTPWRQYHVSVRIKTREFKGTPEIKLLTAAGSALNYDYLKVERTQDWQEHHAVFNSLEHTSLTLFLGCWDGSTGELWWDDARMEETAFVNLVRRPGAPLTIRTGDGRVLREGTDFAPLSDPLLGTQPYAGCYTVWHQPPVLTTPLPEGTPLTADWYHGATVHDDQAGICPSEPRTLELLRDQAERVQKLWQPAAFMMSHDEIRVWNHCAACRAKNQSAGQLLADNIRACTAMLRKVNPSARLYVWSDMFDPHHNARDHYYLARGDFAGSWEGVDPSVTIVPWYFEKRAESLKFFAGRGHRQVIAGYYDSDPGAVREWIKAAAPYDGVEAVMYTTWQNNYRDMETFFRIAREAAGK